MIESGYQYHWLTAYSRGRMSGHSLDWANQPAFFKDYSADNSYALPRPDFTGLSQKSLFELAQEVNSTFATSTSILPPLRCRDISLLLLLTSAPTAKSTFAHGEIWYRSNASAGALHPLEFYLEFPGGDDLPAGLYHYDLLKPALNCLRKDSGLESFTSLCQGNVIASDTTEKTSSICISALFFRTSWKYRERAYRYLLLDCGHALENLALALKFKDLNFAIELDFDDAAVNKNLLLDEQREVTLALVCFESGSAPAATHSEFSDSSASPPKLFLKDQGTENEVIYPALHEIHQATSSRRLKEISDGKKLTESFPKITNWQKIPDDVCRIRPSCSYIKSLSRRRSRRNFTEKGEALSSKTLFLLLDLLSPSPAAASQLQPGIIFSAHGIENFPDGLYLFDPDRRSYALLSSQDCRRKLAAAALDQRWVANAALQFIFFADLESADKEFGPRSYRYFNINAGRLGQRLYLGATSLDLGCCGVGAFYDRELAEVCMLEQNLDPLYMVAVGPVAGKQ